MAHKIKDIKWDEMPRHAFQFMLENDTYFFMWIMPDSSLRYYDYQEDTWNTIWEDDADYQSIIKDRKVYLVSKHFPKPENKKEETKSEWRGHEDGLPPVGLVCELVEDTEFLSIQSGKITIKPKGEKVAVIGHAVRLDNRAVCITLQPVDDMSCGFSTINPDFVQRVKSDREKWVEQAVQLYSEDPDKLGFADLIYECLQSGELPMPEVKK